MILEKLDINIPDKTKPIVVAMSGGVDSSTLAAALVYLGYNVIGMTMKLYDSHDAEHTKKTCCAGIDIYDAKRVASQLKIPHYVVNYESKFKEAVIDNFIDSYVKGYTPIPCVQCNQNMKFNDLLNAAKNIGAATLVTGHYVRKNVSQTGGNTLMKAIDHNKDQSYYLFATTKEQLSYVQFPLGVYTKNEVREIAKSLNLHLSDKPDSQDICFVPNGDYASIIKKYKPDVIKPGNIINKDGQVIGQHQGIINYTVGQRKKININQNTDNSQPLYVIKIIPETQTIMVGTKDDLSHQWVVVNDVNWLMDRPSAGTEVTVKLRSMHSGATCRVFFSQDNQLKQDSNNNNPRDNQNTVVLQLNDNKSIASPGQAAVFYDDDIVLGGGWINSSHKESAHLSSMFHIF